MVSTPVCIMLCCTAKSTEIVVYKATTLLTSDCRLKRWDRENTFKLFQFVCFQNLNLLSESCFRSRAVGPSTWSFDSVLFSRKMYLLISLNWLNRQTEAKLVNFPLIETPQLAFYAHLFLTSIHWCISLSFVIFRSQFRKSLSEYLLLETSPWLDFLLQFVVFLCPLYIESRNWTIGVF